MLPEPVARAVDRVVADYDRRLPGRLEGMYVVGSVALGAWRAARSDIDFVAVLAPAAGGHTRLSPADLRAMRGLHRAEYARGLARMGRMRRPQPLVCNGVFVTWDDLRRPPAEVAPLAGQSAERFTAGRAADVNPVTWHLLARGGVAVRGPEPSSLGVPDDPGRLRAHALENLRGYWRGWAVSTRRGGPGLTSLRQRAVAATTLAWAAGVLGVARSHRTVLAGEVVSKEAAGEHALEAFGDEWHGLVAGALAYWRSTARPPAESRRARRLRAADFVDMVVSDAERRAAAGAPG